MTKEETKQVVIDIIVDVAPDEDLSNVKPDVRLRDQLELDSMDFLDIVMELRKRHNIEVPEAEYPELASLDSCAEYLTPKFEALGSSHGYILIFKRSLWARFFCGRRWWSGQGPGNVAPCPGRLRRRRRRVNFGPHSETPAGWWGL